MRLLAQYLIPSRLEQLPEGLEESDLFSSYASVMVKGGAGWGLHHNKTGWTLQGRS